MDVREVTLIADYFVICTGNSERQLNALAREVRDSLKQQDVLPMNVEGDASSGWILMDYTDVILHIFTPSLRENYALEELWSEAKTVVRIA
jgi:ribosome-associated protein